MTNPVETRPLAAALFMIAAMSVIGVIDNVIPLIARDIGLWQFHAVRAVIALPLVAALSVIGLGSLKPQRLWAVVLRSVTLAISMLFYFSALAIMPIAQALAGLFTSPIFILLISSGLLGNRIGFWRIGAVALGFAGTLMVLQPDPVNFDMRTLIPVAGGFFYALSALATRQLCAHESTVCLLAGMWITLGVMGGIGLLVMEMWQPEQVSFVTQRWTPTIGAAWPWLFVQAIGSVIGVFMIIKAYQLGEPSYVSIFEYSVMIFGPAFALAAFGVPITFMQVIGTLMIAMAGLIIAIRS